jgi:hypothetical protein
MSSALSNWLLVERREESDRKDLIARGTGQNLKGGLIRTLTSPAQPPLRTQLAI